MTQIEQLFKILKHKQQTISVAESCTGGGLANLITSLPSISQVFVGGIIAYSNLIKQNILQVDPQILATHGAVSEQVALQMSHGCRKVCNSTWSLSTTGIAGPEGGSEHKPVGTVWLGICGPNIHEAHKFVFRDINRMQHRNLSNKAALELAIRLAS